MFAHFVLQRQGGKIWQNHGQQNDFSLFLVLVAQQGGFEVPGEEAEDEEDAGAAEEIPCDPMEGELCAESELGAECPRGGAEQGEEADLLPSEEPACGKHRENEKGQRADLALRGGVKKCAGGDGGQNECAGE